MHEMQELLAVYLAIGVLIDLAHQFIDHRFVEVLAQSGHQQSKLFFGHYVVPVLVELLKNGAEVLLVFWGQFICHFLYYRPPENNRQGYSYV